MIKLKDSLQRESVTLGFVTVAFLIASGVFLVRAINGTDVALLDYAGSVTAILAAWLGREWIKTPKVNTSLDNDTADAP